jgi:dipeptidase D
MDVSLTGLHGGHSGDEIHKGYGNAVKIMNEFLLKLSAEKSISIAQFSGGNLRNAIPREAFSTIVISRDDIAWLKDMSEEYSDFLAQEFGDREKEFKFSVKSAPVPSTVMDAENQKKFMDLLSICPHGVIAWSKEMEDLVETSTNLASAKFEPGNIIRIITTQRSSVEKSKDEIAAVIEKHMRDAGAEVTHSEGYPGWEPNLNSEILGITKESYRKLFGNEPLVRAIHAGLECGLIYEKINEIDMISFGPTIKGAHTPEEMVEIITVQKFWDLLSDVLKNIPVK